MTQRDRDQLVVLKKALKKLIKQSQAAQELGISCRQVKRLVRALRDRGDEAVIHGLRGRPSPRKTSAAKREKILRILWQEKYPDFGPTLASEYLANKYQVKIGREALRQIMIAGGLWRERRQKVEEVHQWRGLLGVQPILGRDFAPADELPGADGCDSQPSLLGEPLR
jgi:transposase